MNNRNSPYVPTGMPSGPYYTSSSSTYPPLDTDDFFQPPAQPAMMPPARQTASSHASYYSPPPFNPSYSQTFGRDSNSISQNMQYRARALYPFPSYPPQTYRPLPSAAPTYQPPQAFQPAPPTSLDFTFNSNTGFNAHMHPAGGYEQIPLADGGLEVVEGLFGNAEPRAITITGSPEAVTQIRNAVITEYLAVERKPLSCQEAFIASLKPLQAKGAIADHNMPDTGEGRFALDQMSWDERAALGIEPSDFVLDPTRSVQNSAKPPFQGNVDSLLGLLRVMGKYHNSSYQIGVITQQGDDYDAQIFRAEEDVDAEHTVWLYRECLRDLMIKDKWIEVWYAFAQDTAAKAAAEGISNADILHFSNERSSFDEYNDGYGNASIGSSPASKGKRRRTNTTQATSSRRRTHNTSHTFMASAPSMNAPYMAPTTYWPPTQTEADVNPYYRHNIPPRHNWNGADHEQDNQHLFEDLEDEEILSGHVHPADICGTLMLRLAPKYSNTELHRRINLLYQRLNPAKPKVVSPACITKRWTLPLQAVCKREKLDYIEERSRYHAMRRANGITGGGDWDTTPKSKKRKASGEKKWRKTSTVKKRKTSKVKSERKTSRVKREDSFDADADVDAEFEDDDDEVANATPAVSTRGRRTRKQVNYAAVAEDFDDIKEEDSEEDEEGRPHKRMKKWAEEEEDGSEFEQEDDNGGWL